MAQFKAKARAIELLGRKQIRDSVTALSELMKNAYDADAPWLRVEFYNKTDEQHIIIADGGRGMDNQDITDKWFVLGTNSKASNREKKSPAGRTLMGAKGIGRLASARLGKQLWLFSKTENSKWNIVYLNWDIFENPYLALNDINIPAIYEVDKTEILENFVEIEKKLKEIQLENLKLKGWYTKYDGSKSNQENKEDICCIDDVKMVVNKEVKELYYGIYQSIFHNEVNVKEIVKYIECTKGTVLYIQNLNDDWKRCLACVSSEKKSEDLLAKKQYSRLASFVSTLKLNNTPRDPFELKVYIDGKLWEEDYAYVEEDYNVYDIKLEGYVEKGKFYGKLYALNTDSVLLEQANALLEKGRDVTAGIVNWKAHDCGKYALKICMIEGVQVDSNLNKDDYMRIQRKMVVSGGVSVYRDGVRVLPYGEPENDFLNMEERRSYNAGDYIFSHRNTFGRIDIDSFNNPYLEDKSSREGLIENSQYFYFIKTLENLLIDIARNFLSDARKDSMEIREEYMKKNRERKRAQRENAKIEKEEKRLANIEIQKAKEKLKGNEKKIPMLRAMLEDLKKEWELVRENVNSEDSYNDITNAADSVEKSYYSFIGEIDTNIRELKIDVQKRFESYYGEELLKVIYSFNKECVLSLNRMKGEIKVAFDFCMSYLKQEQEAWELNVGEYIGDIASYKAELLKRSDNIVKSAASVLNDIRENFIDKKKNIIEKYTEVFSSLDAIRGCSYETKLQPGLVKLDKELEKVKLLKQKIADAEGLSAQKYISSTQFIIGELDAEDKLITELLGGIRESAQQEIKKMEDTLVNYDNSVECVYSKDYLIGELRNENIHLKKENEIYSDLANLGMASEIVNHEFNQLFTNVNNAIKNLNPYIKEKNSRYWLNQIEVGFRAISDRQNQLSPMYRSYSLRKKEVILHEFLDSVCKFMDNILTKQEIIVENEIDESVQIVLSPSKMFPVLSNIINNAAYWVLSSDEKIIRFRYEEETQALYIEDSGVGITALNPEDVFEPFISYKPNGRGLGLAIVKKVLESQGYKIEIASDEEKTLQGACFKIILSTEEK